MKLEYITVDSIKSGMKEVAARFGADAVLQRVWIAKSARLGPLSSRQGTRLAFIVVELQGSETVGEIRA